MNPSPSDRVVPASLAAPSLESPSAVSWAAIFAGGVGSAALSLILLVLGVGFGFTAMSPWTRSGTSATAIGVSSIVWLTLTTIFASGLGGYLAGRLRTRWAATHVDEVHFRDTAHGFLAWAIATLVTAGVLTTAVGTIVGGGISAGASLAGGAATAAAGGAAAAAGRPAVGGEAGAPGLGYMTDSLFRRDASATPGTPAAGDGGPQPSTGEVTRIFVQDLRTGAITPDDTRYVGQLVAQRTGLSQQDAEKRVSDTFARAKAAADDAATKAKEAADEARKAGAYAALWAFIALLIGAFSASYAATFGGRQRDA